MTDPTPRDPALVNTETRLPVPAVNTPRSAAAYSTIVAGLVLINLVVAGAASAGFRSPAQAAAFGWPFLAGYLVLGLAGVWFAAQTGFPETWDPRVPLRDRLLLPGVVGLGLGAVAIVVDALTGWTALAAAQMHIPSIHIDWPLSLIIYPGGAAISNIIFYLVPVPLLVWLVSSLALQGRFQERTFWVVGALGAAIEPLLQDLGSNGHPDIAAVTFAEDYVLNLAQVVAFRRAGFGATVVLRTAFYLVWHVLWGAIHQ